MRSIVKFFIVVPTAVVLFSLAIALASGYFFPVPDGNQANYAKASVAMPVGPTPMAHEQYSAFLPFSVGQSVTTPDGIMVIFLLEDIEAKTVSLQIKWADGQYSIPTTINKNGEFLVGGSSRFIVREQIDSHNQPIMIVEYWSNP